MVGSYPGVHGVQRRNSSHELDLLREGHPGLEAKLSVGGSAPNVP